MTTEATDPQKYRVNLICSCQQDVAYGYGANPLDARRNAEHAFREHHGTKTQYRQIVVEEAVPHAGGSHYELFAAGLRYEFTRGLGYELYGLESIGDDYSKRDHATHPFVFETHSPERTKALCEALKRLASDGTKNGKLRNAAKRAHEEIAKIARAVW